MKKNWIYYMQEGLKSMWRKKEEKEYPYNIEFGDGRTVEESDKKLKDYEGIINNAKIEAKNIFSQAREKILIVVSDGAPVDEMDKMQKELVGCGCKPDCGCKE